MSISAENIKSIEFRECYPKNKKMTCFIPKHIKYVEKVSDNLQKIKTITNAFNNKQLKNIKDMIKHIDKSGFKNKLFMNKEKNQKITEFNSSFTDNRKNRKSQSYNAIDGEDINDKIRSSSYLNTENTVNNDNTNDYNSFSRSVNNSKLKDKTKIVKVLSESKNYLNHIASIAINENFSKNCKKVNIIPVKISDKTTFQKSLNNINSSLDCVNNNGNTIINIHNSFNIKIKDNKNYEKVAVNKLIDLKENNIDNGKIDKKINLKGINSKSLKKSSEFPKKEVIVNDQSISKLPQHLTNTKQTRISSLMGVNRSRIRSNVDNYTIKNENSLISFENSLISKMKKEQNECIDKKTNINKDRNDDISLSYSDDEKSNNNNNIRKLVSVGINDDRCDNDDEFIKFCENLNKKILI